ncbi:hypothetical protein Tco_0821838 [Tanacetum coccineum]|uniref:Uncharacterized protein n=1 Tax=Tanacetum coccineum TaxID=301880 RepID=A0ABQ5AI74_9ASTR
MKESTRTQSDSLEAIFFKWSTFCEVSKFAYIYAGREKVSSVIWQHHRNAHKKYQTDHWNEMCYQLLKLMTKQLKNPGMQLNKVNVAVTILKDLTTAKSVSTVQKDKTEKDKNEIVIKITYRDKYEIFFVKDTL